MIQYDLLAFFILGAALRRRLGRRKDCELCAICVRHCTEWKAPSISWHFLASATNERDLIKLPLPTVLTINDHRWPHGFFHWDRQRQQDLFRILAGRLGFWWSVKCWERQKSVTEASSWFYFSDLGLNAAYALTEGVRSSRSNGI